MFRLHREGNLIVTVASTGAILIIVISAFLLPYFLFIPVLLASAVLLFLIFRFFRIPSRGFREDLNSVLAPADGTVVNIETVTETEYFKGPATLISIFMSIYNVHINWYPISGEIKYFRYHPGNYLVARHPKSSELNERTTVVISDQSHEILVRQIAGYVARRIVCYAEQGIKVKQAEELGFIKFGSRLDIYLPPGIQPLVVKGDKTTGGVTPLAHWK